MSGAEGSLDWRNSCALKRDSSAPLMSTSVPVGMTKNMYNNQEQGQRGEDIAAWYLEKNGYPIVKKHFTDRFGEIDLVVMDKDQLVFVEVKYGKYPFIARIFKMLSTGGSQYGT